VKLSENWENRRPSSLELLVPLDAKGLDDLRAKIMAGLGSPASEQGPRWRLAKPIRSGATDDYRERRRALLMVALSLPGTVDLDFGVERSLDPPAGVRPLIGVEEMAREAATFGQGSFRFAWPLGLTPPRYDVPGVLTLEGPGYYRVIASFGSEWVSIGDGTVGAISTARRTRENWLSDNDDIPPGAACWLAEK